MVINDNNDNNNDCDNNDNGRQIILKYLSL